MRATPTPSPTPRPSTRRSIIAGWNGTGVQDVQVKATKASVLSVYTPSGGTLLPLGTVALLRSYVPGARTFGVTGATSKLAISGASLTITLGTASGSTNLVATTGNVTWTPATAVLDLAGNAAATTAYTETDNDNDF